MRIYAPWAAAAALFAVALVGPAQAAELRVGQSGEVSSLDPHYQNNRFNNAVRQHVFEALVAQDNLLRPQPRLATAWRLVDDTTWEFKLRPGVTFQNGAAFTADDVIYSLCRVMEVKDSSSSFLGYLAGVNAVTAPDPLTVVIKTDAPSPQLPADLSTIGVISSRGAKVAYKTGGCAGSGWPTRAEFDAGALALGAGPYKVARFTRGQQLILERNPAYWGPKPSWDRVEFTAITDDSLRVATLLAGDVDMIEEPGLEDLKVLESDPAMSVVSTPSTRIIYLALDQHLEPTPGVSGTNGKNPFKDHRVREAFSKAIDRAAIVKQLLFNQGAPVGQLLAPGMYGYNPALTPSFDPAAARALLAEAGYADGFDVILGGPNDRYMQDDKILGVVATMLNAAGVRAVAKAQDSKTYFERRNKFELSVYLGGFNLPNADTALKQLVASRDPKAGLGGANYGRYSNREVDALIVTALATTNDAARDKLLQAASAAAMRDYAVIPLHAEKTSWAMRKGLSFTPRTDQYTLAMEVKPAP